MMKRPVGFRTIKSTEDVGRPVSNESRRCTDDCREPRAFLGLSVRHSLLAAAGDNSDGVHFFFIFVTHPGKEEKGSY